MSPSTPAHPEPAPTPAPPQTALPVAITQGNVCGNGPEVIAKFFRTPDAKGCFVLGDVAVMRRAAAWTGGMLVVAREPRHPREAPPTP